MSRKDIMNEESAVIYQSSEIVLIAGLYEVVGAPNTTYSLLTNDVFPDHDGRAVGWHLRAAFVTSQLSGGTFDTGLPHTTASESSEGDEWFG